MDILKNQGQKELELLTNFMSLKKHFNLYISENEKMINEFNSKSHFDANYDLKILDEIESLLSKLTVNEIEK